MKKEEYSYRLDLEDCFKNLEASPTFPTLTKREQTQYLLMNIASIFLSLSKKEFVDIARINTINYSFVFLSENKESMDKAKEFYDYIAQEKETFGELVKNMMVDFNPLPLSNGLDKLYNHYVLKKSFSNMNSSDIKRPKI